MNFEKDFRALCEKYKDTGIKAMFLGFDSEGNSFIGKIAETEEVLLLASFFIAHKGFYKLIKKAEHEALLYKIGKSFNSKKS